MAMSAETMIEVKVTSNSLLDDSAYIANQPSIPCIPVLRQASSCSWNGTAELTVSFLSKRSSAEDKLKVPLLMKPEALKKKFDICQNPGYFPTLPHFWLQVKSIKLAALKMLIPRIPPTQFFKNWCTRLQS